MTGRPRSLCPHPFPSFPKRTPLARPSTSATGLTILAPVARIRCLCPPLHVRTHVKYPVEERARYHATNAEKSSEMSSLPTSRGPHEVHVDVRLVVIIFCELFIRRKPTRKPGRRRVLLMRPTLACAESFFLVFFLVTL